MKFEFDPQADAVYLELTDADVDESKEVQPGISWTTMPKGGSWALRFST